MKNKSFPAIPMIEFKVKTYKIFHWNFFKKGLLKNYIIILIVYTLNLFKFFNFLQISIKF